MQLVRAGLYLLLEIGQRVSMQQVHLAARHPPSPAARPHPPSACPRACARPRAPTPGLLPTSRPDIGRLVERRPPHEHRPPRPLRSAPRPAAARAARQDAAEHARAWPPGASSLELTDALKRASPRVVLLTAFLIRRGANVPSLSSPASGTGRTHNSPLCARRSSRTRGEERL